MYHVTVEQLRLIEWARQWNWAVKFPDNDTPEEFRSWFPATDVQYAVCRREQKTFEGSHYDFSIPLKSGERTVNLTIVDGARVKEPGASNPNFGAVNVLKLHEWAEFWFTEINNVWANGVQTLSECCRQLDIIHYDPLSRLIEQKSYAVYPSGDLEFQGTSENGPVEFELELIIAGKIPINAKMGMGVSLPNLGTSSFYDLTLPK